VKALASGSSGNAFLVQAGGTTVLVDAGIPLARLLPALAADGVTPDRLTCLLLTHEHADHLTAAASLARRYRVPVLGSAGTLACLTGRGGERVCVTAGSRMQLGELAVTPFAIPHDGAQPVGYLLEEGETRVCLATDLGHVPPELLPVFRRCELLIVEANHDAQRLWNGPYPRFLKERVAAPTGHLSNDQTGECLVACASGAPQRVWLAHLSAVNNSPRSALRSVGERLRRADIDTMQVEVALRDRPSLTWSSTEECFQPRLL
jgi:phosphoribosyl 1,2-cyclic phosphodiesterase